MGHVQSTAAACTIAGNPDIAGPGARISVYGMNLLCFIPAFAALADSIVSDYELESMETMSTTNLVVAFGILISCFIQASTLGLSSFHAAIVLSMSWTNNTNVFIYFLLYVAQLRERNEHWVKTLKEQVVSLICLPFCCGHRNTVTSTMMNDEEAAARTGGVHKAPKSSATEFRRLFKRVTLIFGSLHLTLMSALGVWLWISPRTFGTADSACAVDHAHLAIAGGRVPFGNERLREFSLFIYGLFLIPGVNLLIPMGVFLGLYIFHDKFHKMVVGRSLLGNVPSPAGLEAPAEPGLPLDMPAVPGVSLAASSGSINTVQDRAPILRMSSPKSPVFPAFLGLVFLLLVNVIFIIDIELTLKGNQSLQDSSEAEWGFGQVLAVLLLFLPLRDLVEMIFRRRQELQTQMDHELHKAIIAQDVGAIRKWGSAGANIESQADNGHTALEEMTRAENLEGVQAVIALRANVNAAFQDKTTALEVATIAQQWGLVSELVNNGADVRPLFKDQTTALEAATVAQQWGLASELVKAGADVNTLFKDQTRPLELAIAAEQWSLVSDISKAGADVNIVFEGMCHELDLGVERELRLELGLNV